MKKQTRSILQELNNLHGNKDNDYFIDSTANNIIESAINLLFLNSIKSGDPKKFKRSMQRIIESKKSDDES